MGGGGGKKGGGADKQAGLAAGTMAGIAKDLYESTDPMRKGMIGGFEDFIAGDFDPSSTPMYGQGKYALESQYDVAKENIMSNLPQGGSLLSALAGADISKAGDMATMMGGISQDVYNKAYGMATEAPQTAISGLGGAASSMAGLAGQEQAAKAGALGDIGMGMGMMAKASDERLKKNIKKIGQYKGMDVIEFEYVWGGGREVGLIAQQVMEVMPSAVVINPHGYLYVNYARILI